MKKYTLEQIGNGYSWVPEKGKKSIAFKSKIDGFKEMASLIKEKKISTIHAYQLLTELDAIKDFQTVEPSGAEMIDLIKESLAEKTIAHTLEKLEVQSLIDGGLEKPTFVPCKECGKHGKIVTKTTYANVSSKTEGLVASETLFEGKHITEEERKNLDLEIFNSNMPVQESIEDIISNMFGGILKMSGAKSKTHH